MAPIRRIILISLRQQLGTRSKIPKTIWRTWGDASDGESDSDDSPGEDVDELHSSDGDGADPRPRRTRKDLRSLSEDLESGTMTRSLRCA